MEKSENLRSNTFGTLFCSFYVHFLLISNKTLNFRVFLNVVTKLIICRKFRVQVKLISEYLNRHFLFQFYPD
jgi:hypothetical protein